MAGNMKLVDEIVKNASVIPVECQEHILDLIKAMAFTREVIENENGRFNGTSTEAERTI